MNKHTLLPLIPLIIFIILGVGLIVSFIQKPSTTVPIFFGPTPTPIAGSPTTQHNFGISLTSIDPAFGNTSVSLNPIIIATFNNPLPLTDSSFTSSPILVYTAAISNNQYIITPTYPLQPGTTYHITFRIGEQVFNSSFATTSLVITPTGAPTDVPPYDNTRQVDDETALLQRPDIYIANRAPADGEDFHVDAYFTDTPTSHYYLSVELIGSYDTAKTDFISWLLKQGLQKEQISQLDIRYYQ